MTNHETSPDQPPRSPADPALAGRHRGLVLASAILATGGMLVAGGYGLGNDLLVLWALAIDAALDSAADADPARMIATLLDAGAYSRLIVATDQPA